MEQTISISDFFRDLGFDYTVLEIDKPIDVSHLRREILTLDKNGDRTWRQVLNIVKKEMTDSYVVNEFGLVVSPLHKFWARISNSEPAWIDAHILADLQSIQLFHQEKGWISCSITKFPVKTDILDIEVADSHSYFANGILSHNTMYGDPDEPPGGKAIPFHASVRIKLSSGAPITDDGTKDGNPIGINVIAKVIKNKVALPFRKCNFEIHFGVGIREHEQLFDVMRPAGEVEVNGKLACVEGEGGWKTFYVSDMDTLERVIEKKFRKEKFDELWNVPEYLPYLEGILESAMVVKMGQQHVPEIDSESYVEVQSVANLMAEELGGEE